MTNTSRPCIECGNSSSRLVKGDGKCNLCGGTGIDVGVAVLSGFEGDCERCGGTGICPVCYGTGVGCIVESTNEFDIDEKNKSAKTIEMTEEELV